MPVRPTQEERQYGNVTWIGGGTAGRNAPRASGEGHSAVPEQRPEGAPGEIERLGEAPLAETAAGAILEGAQ